MVYSFYESEHPLALPRFNQTVGKKGFLTF